MFPLFTYEKALLDKGIKYVAGVDEVGRGPLAGPMIVCAVILDIEAINMLSTENSETYRKDAPLNNDVFLYNKINDSKKLSAKSREQLEIFIKTKLLSYKIVHVSHAEIDDYGISAVTQKAFFDAVMGLAVKPAHIITDNFPIYKIVPDTQTNLPKGDSKSITVAAASILGKVYRDALMTEEHKKYPEYGFNQHKGYGTSAHIAALKKYGPCEIHRKSFEPIKSMLLTKYL